MLQFERVESLSKRRKIEDSTPPPPEPEKYPYGACKLFPFIPEDPFDINQGPLFTHIKGMCFSRSELFVLDERTTEYRIIRIQGYEIIEIISWNRINHHLDRLTSIEADSRFLYLTQDTLVYKMDLDDMRPESAAIVMQTETGVIGLVGTSCMIATVGDDLYGIPVKGGRLTRVLSDERGFQRCVPLLCCVTSMISSGQRLFFTEVHQEMHRIISINLENNLFTIEEPKIGTGKRGNRDGPISTAEFDSPCDLAADDHGNLYIADRGNNVIRIVKKGIVRTLSDASTASSTAPVYLHVDKPTLISFDSDGGVLFVVEGTDTSQLKVIRGLPGYLESYVSTMELPRSEYGEKIIIKTSGASLELHKAIVNLRCPTLLAAELSHVDLHPSVASAFTNFIYSETLPLRPPPGITRDKFYTSFAILSSVAGLEMLAEATLQLFGSRIDDSQIESLQRFCDLFIQAAQSNVSRTFAPFVASRLARHRSGLDKYLPQLKQKLFPEYKDDYILLLEHLATSSPPEEEHRSLRISPKLTSLRRQMRQLLRSQKDADFTIQLGVTDIPCHIFVLAPRWSYFNRMMSMGGREVSEKRLRLPGIESNDGGGLSFNAFMSLLEFCYTGAVADESVSLLKLSDVLDLLAAADYYCLESGSGSEIGGADFGPFLALLDELVRQKCATGPIQVEIPTKKKQQSIFLDD